MKRILSLIISFCMIFSWGISKKSYANENNMQAAWITTVYNADWPKNKGNAQVQKQEMINILDTLKDTGINTVMFQVRPKGDALYKSNINPWSDVLTGTQGKDPGYDPLQFVIEEAHKRGMKVHTWLNPYRVTTSGTDLSVLNENHQAVKNPSWTLVHSGRIYFNPELPEVKQHISDTVAEIVTNYDIDGIHFDDYFYPTDYPLPQGESKDGEVANARRNHINEMIVQVRDRIKSIKPSVEFGISPRGIWKNKGSDSLGSDTRGSESYYSDYADTVKWMQNDWIDYIVPQVYWERGHSAADYTTLVKWWSDIASTSNTDLYIGQGIYKDEVAVEIGEQLLLNRQYPQIKGSVFYATSDIMLNRANAREQIKNVLNTDDDTTEDVMSDIRDHWAENEIKDFINKGYIDGYPEGDFKPNDSMTRAEFVKTFNKVFGLTGISGKVFDDTIGHWAQDEIDIAVTNGVCQGTSDTEFEPNEPITRQEAAKMLANYKNISDENHDKSQTYYDYNEVDDWAKNELEAVIEYGYMNGTPEGYLNPKNPIKRAEVVAMLSRVK